MSNFGGLILTNKGRALQAKVQAGAVLHFNRIGIGDGNLGGQQISDLNALVSEKKSLAITKLKTQSGGKAIVGGVLSNSVIVTGFYLREIGVFAQDPTDGEILYCYANAGAGAEYIPAGGGPDIVEKNIDIITLTANAASITATIASGIYALVEDVGDMSTVTTTSKIVAGAIIELKTAIQNINPVPPDGSITPAKLSFDPATQIELDALAGVGNTKTVKQLDNEAAAHLADGAAHGINTKANKTQEPWIAPTLLNGWVHSGGTEEIAGYFKDEFSSVHLRGAVKNGLINNVVFILPDGYRPSYILRNVATSNGAYGDIVILTTGEVKLVTGSSAQFSLTNVSFRV
jgi:hypothetical protein